MFRIALIALALVVGLLIVLSLMPERARPIPESTIELSGAEVVLYPEADPEAVWTFASPAVSYEPDSRQTTLNDVRDGARIEGGEVDFTVASEQLTIDRNDNLRGERIVAFLVESEDCLVMSAENGVPVVIDQDEGRFEVPSMRITGPTWGDGTRFPRVRASFDLTTFEAGGPGTSVVTELLTERDDTRSSPCED